MRDLKLEELEMVTGGICQNHITADQTGECPPGGTLNPLAPPTLPGFPRKNQNGGPFEA